MTSTKVKINELTSDTTLVSGDEFIFQETGGGTTKKINFNDLSAAVESNISVSTSQLTADSDLDLGAFDLIATEATADEFIGDLRGAVIFKAQAGEALSVGEVVYISGISGNTTVVSKADADDASKMPAFGIAASAASLNTPVDIYTFGTLGNLDTDTPGWSIGDELFVSTTAGALQNTPPTGESALIQKIAKVTRVHLSAGSIKITGAGRANATPNLNNGNIFIGNVSNQSVSSSLATEIESNITEASVTQHQAAIDHDALTNFVANEHIDWTSDQGATNIHLNNITGITTTEMASANVSQFTNDAGYITSTLSEEQVEDYVGGMLTGNTETGITVTYQDSDGTIDFEVNGLTTTEFASANISQWTNDAGYITDTLTTEEVQDIVGAMFSGNTETDITVTYQDSDGTIDVTLDALDTSNITSGTFADARIAESNVTQHEAALDHDALTNFVANEHINHTSVSITAGDGLSGGGDISSTRTIDLDIGGQTLVTADSGDMVIIEDASDANNIKKVNVSDFLSSGGGGGLTVDTVVKTANFTAVAGNQYLCDTSGGSFTLTFPATPSVGDKVGIVDYAQSFATNSLLLGRNGVKVLRQSADGSIGTDDWSGNWMYYGTDGGWLPEGIMPAGLSDDEVATAYNAAVSVVSEADAKAGTSTTAYRWTPQRARQASTYNDWQIKTANYTCVADDQIIVNSAGTTTMTLPASPTAGDSVVISNQGAGVCTVGRNGSNIKSLAEDGTLNSGNSTQLVYVDGTIGWGEL